MNDRKKNSFTRVREFAKDFLNSADTIGKLATLFTTLVTVFAFVFAAYQSGELFEIAFNAKPTGKDTFEIAESDAKNAVISVSMLIIGFFVLATLLIISHREYIKKRRTAKDAALALADYRKQSEEESQRIWADCAKQISEAHLEVNTIKAAHARSVLLSSSNSDDFRKISRFNSMLDMEIFNTGFVELYHEAIRTDSDLQKFMAQRVMRMMPSIRHNLWENLNQLKRISERIVGSECSTNLKVIVPSPSSGGTKLDTRTVYRDSDSFTVRKARNRLILPADQDTAHAHILENAGGTFQCDDLRSYPGYSNPRKGWDSLYNSILVVGVDNLRGRRSENVVQGFLTIDSLDGKLSNEYLKFHIAEFSHRISVLFYRLAQMKIIEDQFKQKEGAKP